MFEHQGGGTAGDAGTTGLVDRLGWLARDDMALRSEDELLGLARDIEHARSLLEAAGAHVAVHLDGRNATVRQSGLRTAQWLAQEPRQSKRGCKRRLRVAKRLAEHLELVDAAVTGGLLSWDHAEVIVNAADPRILRQFAEIQESLIDAADGCVFEHWAQFVKGVARQLDVDGGHDPAGDISSNRMSMHIDPEGALVFDGELVGDLAIATEASIEKVTDELFRRYSADRAEVPDLPIPDRRTLRALAFAEICRRAHIVDADGKAPVNLTTMIVHSDDPTGAAYTPQGGRFPAEAVAALRCDEMIETLVMSSTGVPLHMGRATRLFTKEQRRSMAARDGGCVFPGCDEPISHCVFHHALHWARDMGGTDTRFGAPLCPHHHGVVHSTGWQMQCLPGEWFSFTTPTGTTLFSQRWGRHRNPSGSGDGTPPTGDPPGGP